MPRGFAVNVERAWQRTADERPEATLLALIRALDENLETILSEPKAETVKLVTFRDTRPPAQRPPSPKPTRPEPPVASEPWTRDQMAAAKARRTRELGQLQARMGRLPGFQRSVDDVVFTLPIEPHRPSELRAGLRSVSSLHLIVPRLYPLQKLRVQLNDVAAVDAEPVEDLFAAKAAEKKHMTLTSHVNHLVQNLAAWDRQARDAAPAVEEQTAPQGAPSAPESKGKGHVHVIPRPPEWDVGPDGDGQDSGESGSDPEDQTEPEGGAALPDEAEPTGGRAGPQRGAMVTLPGVELNGIELLELSLLSISVRCGRCRAINELTGLGPGAETTSCSRCATPLGASFSPEPVHAHSTQAGVADVAGGRVADVLPSMFVPTCGRCSTAGAGLVSGRGETVTNVCRGCHDRFAFKLADVKLLAGPEAAEAEAAAGPGLRELRAGMAAGRAAGTAAGMT